MDRVVVSISIKREYLYVALTHPDNCITRFTIYSDLSKSDTCSIEYHLSAKQ